MQPTDNASKPRVALYFFRLGGSSGGAERMICQLSGALSARGFHVILVSWDEADAQAFFPIDERVHWYRLGFAPGARDKLRRVKHLRAVLQRERIHVLTGFVMSADKTVWAGALLAGVKIIAAERNGPSMYQHRIGAAGRMTVFALLHLATRIAIQFPRFAQGYPRTLHKRMVAIGNPVPAVQRRASPISMDATGRRTLLYVGRLDGVQKRPALLIEAFAAVAQKHPTWRLAVIGDGPDRDSLLRLGEQLGLGQGLEIRAASDHVFDAYAAAQLFAMPSAFEGFPNAMAEAMAHGLPAIGFEDAEGVANLIEPDCGWLAKGQDDVTMLAAALDAAMSDDQGRLEKGANALVRAQSYAQDAAFDAWADLHMQAAAPRTEQ